VYELVNEYSCGNDKELEEVIKMVDYGEVLDGNALNYILNV